MEPPAPKAVPKKKAPATKKKAPKKTVTFEEDDMDWDSEESEVIEELDPEKLFDAATNELGFIMDRARIYRDDPS